MNLKQFNNDNRKRNELNHSFFYADFLFLLNKIYIMDTTASISGYSRFGIISKADIVSPHSLAAASASSI